MTSRSSQPPARNDFRVAVICALPIEAGMVKSIFDKDFANDGMHVLQAEGDRNTYTIGVIGKHNVVLVHMSGMGATDAATAVADLRKTFPFVDVAFVVGICGASPENITTKQEICLGDCIISTALIRYAFGRQYPGQLSRKTGLEDSLGRARPEIRSLLAALQTPGEPQKLEKSLAHYLTALQEKQSEASYPGSHKDRIFNSDYLHVHRNIAGRCDECVEGSSVCTRPCREIGCKEAKPRASLVEFEKTEQKYLPRLHFGRYGSADIVLKSGNERDEYTKVDKIIAFEMEAAGIWDSLPTLVIKSACDYADSHKNKDWQGYAAATAAAGLKALLEYWRVVDAAYTADVGVKESIPEIDKLIRKHYHDSGALLIKRLSGQELELEKCYINLALIDRSIRMDDKQQKMSFSLEARLRLEASEVDQRISLETLFESRKLGNDQTVIPRRVFIQGRAGIGKTTLCKKIVYEFLKGRLGSTLFDRLLWIPLRSLKSDRKGYGWHELLHDTFGMSSDKCSVYGKRFDSDAFLSKTLLLFDGLDEISYRWNEEDAFYRFLNKIIRSAPNVIITSRPQGNTFSLQQFDLDLETVGFTTDQVSVYMKNCVGNLDTIAKMKSLISQKPLMQGLLRIPIQLDAFCYTWNEEGYSDVGSSGAVTPHSSDGSSSGNLTTMTTLYESIVIELCKKDLRLLNRLCPTQRAPSFKIQDDFKDGLNLLGEIALQGLLSNIVEFNPRHWDKLGSHLYQSNREFSKIFGSTLDRLSFLRTSDHSTDYTKRTYHFIHLTFQEFFAAKCFVKHWQQNKPLVAIQFDRQASPKSNKMPFAFIQEEKYNPQYGIFWRFVAGIMDSKDEEVRFFAQLQDELVDLLGCYHRRLLMYCMSEVTPVPDSKIHDLRSREMELLRQGLLVEYNQTDTVKLGSEAEFPEILLRELLQDDSELPYTKTLWMIRQRSAIGMQTVEAVGCKLASEGPLEIRLEAAGILWKHSIVCSEQILAQAINVLIAGLKDQDKYVRMDAAGALGGQSSLSEAAIKLLITALNDEESYVRSSAARALGGQSSLSEAAINALITALKDEDSDVRSSAARALGGQSSLSEAAINALIAALKDEDSDVRSSAAYALVGQSSLSEAAFDILVSMLEGGQDVALDVLRQQPNFYKLIRRFTSLAWKHIWGFWLRSGTYGDISCYEFAGTLYVWSNGVQHEILTDSALIARFRYAVLGGLESTLEEPITDASYSIAKGKETLSETAITSLRLKSKKKSKLKFWKRSSS